MSIHYGQYCPVTKAAEIVGERWTIPIIRELLLGTTRFTEFQRALSRISPALLSKRLGELQRHGLVMKKCPAGQVHPQYYLTPAGRELGPVVIGMGEWAMRWARSQMTDDELDVEMLMHDLQRRIDSSQLPDGQNVIKFHFPGLQTFSVWWVVIEPDGSRELCASNPGKPAHLTITSDLKTMTQIWIGDLDTREAQRTGRLTAQGDPTLARTLRRWLRGSLLAHVRPAVEANA